ncbi:MAG: glycosyltransferase [bacterium]
MVAHVCVPYLRATETFIYDRIAHPADFRSAVVTNEPVINRRMFPHEPVYSLAERSVLRRKSDAAFRRVAGFSPFYAGAFRRSGADVVHAHYGPVGCSVLSEKTRGGLPLMTSFYGVDASALLTDRAYRAGYRELFSRSGAISVLSQDMKTRLCEAGCPEEKILIHHLAVDTGRVKRRVSEPPGEEIRITFAGRMVEKKGAEFLVRAFEKVLKSCVNARLDLAGDGPLLPRVRELVERLGLGDAVRFHGMRSRDEVLALMEAAHVFALFSVTSAGGDREGTPTVLIEAGAVGLPVVSTIHAGIPEIVIEGETGFLVPERDVTEFAKRLVILCGDRDLRARMGAAARLRIESEFSLETVIKQLEADYLRLMGRA